MVRNQLEQIQDHRRRLLGDNHIATGEVLYTLGLFEFFLLGNEQAAEAFILAALRTYEMQLGSNHVSTRHVNAVLAFIRQKASSRVTAEIFGKRGEVLLGSHAIGQTPSSK